MLAKANSCPFAPPLLEDSDLKFFVDKAGVQREVEMRGMCTMEGIFFKAKDVARVFQSDRFVDTIQRSDTTYEEFVDFVWFIMQKSEN